MSCACSSREWMGVVSIISRALPGGWDTLVALLVQIIHTSDSNHLTKSLYMLIRIRACTFCRCPQAPR